MQDWLPGAELILAPNGGVPYTVNVGDKGVIHTTEGDTLDGAVSAYRASGSWPHVTASPFEDRIACHVPFSRAAMALWNTQGNSYQTNTAGITIQVEVVARAGLTHTYPDSWYRWLADRVIRPISDACALPARICKFYGAMDGTIASEYWAGRMDQAEFEAFSGWVGHQEVGDGNDHWDPGKLNETLLLVMAFGGGEVYDSITNATWAVGSGSLTTGGFLMGLNADQEAQILNSLAAVYPPYNRALSLPDLMDAIVACSGRVDGLDARIVALAGRIDALSGQTSASNVAILGSKLDQLRDEVALLRKSAPSAGALPNAAQIAQAILQLVQNHPPG